MRLVFYAPTDWLRLATKLAATASPCAQYYVSVPPLVADKTQSHADQAWRIRALGPNVHALAEVNMNAWAGWVTSTAGNWYAAGVEARRRLAAAGFDVTAGDLWAVNEFSSAVRRGDGSARENARNFVRGLHDGDGSAPVAKGVVFITGMSQATTTLSVYQENLQASGFWDDMARYVRDWSQEQYADVRNVAVPGADLAARRDALVDYLDHQLVLARVGPAETAAARAFLETASSPLANAAWQWESGFGWTNVSAELMKHFVSTQVYALRHFRATALPAGAVGSAGFAWAPRNPTAATDLTAQSGEILERLAAAIRDSGYDAAPEDPAAAACAPAWCAGDQPDAWLNNGWQSFRTWQLPPPPPPADTTPPETSISSAPAGAVASRSASVAFAASEAGSSFECSLDGAAYAACVSPASYAELADGTHTFLVRAVDAAGNADQTPAQASWTVDGTPPETTINSAPAGTVASRTASVAFVAGEAGSRFECSRDGAAYAACVSPVSYTGLADGAHTVSVRAIDAAGNVDSSPAQAGWTVDATPPNTSFTSVPPSPTKNRSATFKFASTEAGSFECSLDGRAWAGCTSPAGVSSLAKGYHTFRVRARDAVGNVDRRRPRTPGASPRPRLARSPRRSRRRPRSSGRTRGPPGTLGPRRARRR